MQLDLNFVDETELTDGERTTIGALLPEAWEERYPGARTRAWTQHAPMYRLVAQLDGVVVANQSVFDLSVDSPVFGLGDLAVHPDHQHVGIAREMVTLTVADLRERTDAVILTSAHRDHVRRLFTQLGFHAVADDALAFLEPVLDANRHDWLASVELTPTAPLQIRGTC